MSSPLYKSLPLYESSPLSASSPLRAIVALPVRLDILLPFALPVLALSSPVSLLSLLANMVSSVKARVVLKALENNGWELTRCTGSHHIWHKPGTELKKLNVDYHDKGDFVPAATVDRVVKALGAENVPEDWLPGGRYKPAASEAMPPCVVDEAKAKKASKDKTASTSKKAQNEHTPPSKKGREKPGASKGKGKQKRK